MLYDENRREKQAYIPICWVYVHEVDSCVLST